MNLNDHGMDWKKKFCNVDYSLRNKVLFKKIQRSKYPIVKLKRLNHKRYNIAKTPLNKKKRESQERVDHIFVSTHYFAFKNEKIDIQYLGPRKGYGVIAIDNIPENEIVCMYFGLLQRKKPRARRGIWEVVDEEKKYWIDSRKDEESYSTFLNDDHIDPNLKVVLFKPTSSEFKFPFFVTSRKVLKNEELTFCYKGDPSDFWWRKNEEKYSSLKYELRKPKLLTLGKSLQKIFEYHVDNRITEDSSSFAIVDCDEKGMGVIAKRHFSKDSFLMCYSGEEVDEKDLEDDSYVYEIHIKNKRKWIDAFHSNCFSRYLNDNNESPNVYVKPMIHPKSGQTYIVFLAKKDIVPGEQLEYNYGGGSRNYDWRKKSKSNFKAVKTEVSTISIDNHEKGSNSKVNETHEVSSASQNKSENLELKPSPELLESKLKISSSTTVPHNIMQPFGSNHVQNLLSDFRNTLLWIFDLRDGLVQKKFDDILKKSKMNSHFELHQLLSKFPKETSPFLSLWKDFRKLYEQCIIIEGNLNGFKYKDSESLSKQREFIVNQNLFSSLDSIEALIEKHGDYKLKILSYKEKINSLFTYVEKLFEEHGEEGMKNLNSSKVEKKGFDESRQVAENLQTKEINFNSKNTNKKEINNSNPDKSLDIHEFDNDIKVCNDMIKETINTTKNIKGELTYMEVLKQCFENPSTKIENLKEYQNQLLEKCQEDIEHWINAISESEGKSLSDVQNLLKIHTHMNAKVTSYQDFIDSYRIFSNYLIENQYLDSVETKSKEKCLQDHYSFLIEKIKQRENKLLDSLNAYRVLRDIEDEELWIYEKEILVDISSKGRDIQGVQRLIEIHDKLCDEITSHESKFGLVHKCAEEIIKKKISVSEEVQSKLTSLDSRWVLLKMSAEQRKKPLNHSLIIHRYIAALKETDIWLKSKEKFIMENNNFEHSNIKLKELLNDLQNFNEKIYDLDKQMKDVCLIFNGKKGFNISKELRKVTENIEGSLSEGQYVLTNENSVTSNQSKIKARYIKMITSVKERLKGLT